MDGERVKLVIFGREELQMIQDDPEELESKLGYKIFLYKDKNLNQAIEKKIQIMDKKPSNDKWFSYYGIYHKDLDIIIGLIGFKDRPDALGETEIIYGVAPNFQGKGYTTEALSLLVNKGFEHPELKQLVAVTDKQNLPSQRVLSKNGFAKIIEDEVSIRWGLKNPNNLNTNE